jgi:hypothetical protein
VDGGGAGQGGVRLQRRGAARRVLCRPGPRAEQGRGPVAACNSGGVPPGKATAQTSGGPTVSR